jgi:uncharacterized protein (TIGR02117 family)
MKPIVMPKGLKTTAKIISIPIAVLLGAALLYVIVAFGFLLFPANQHAASAPTEVDAYIISNGVHTDFLLPVQTSAIDWKSIFDPHAVTDPAVATDYIAIGWGDREFYLNTPEWKDLTASRAFHALFGHDSSLIHVEYFSRDDVTHFSQRYRLHLTQAQYKSLVNYVLNSTALQHGSAQPIAGRHYGSDDAFFEANGHYNLYTTCNTWTGDGLQVAGVPVSRWTPFDGLVYWGLTPDK